MKIIINKFINKLNLSSKNKFFRIEFLGLGKISGWIFDKKDLLNEVRLVLGNKIVAKSSIDINRPDVCSKYDYQGSPGFELKLPSNLRNFDLDADISLIALSNDGKKIVNCVNKKIKKEIYSKIKQILKNPNIGLHGNLDGMQSDGLIHGWASWISIKKIAWVWLQCEGHEPKSIKCNVYREDISESEFKSSKVGFIIDPYKLEESYSEKRYFISFDKEGKYKLPEAKSESLPKIKFEEFVKDSNVTVIDQKKGLGYIENKNKAPENLKESWQDLENFRLFLDGLETQLDRSEKMIILRNKHLNQKNFLSKIKRFLIKRS